MSLRQLYGDVVDDVPEGYRDVFGELTARGRSPSAILAAIEYVETHATQREVGEKHGVSSTTVRSLYHTVLEHSDRDTPVGATQGRGRTELTCERCGDTFTVKQSVADGRRFCSMECFRAATNIELTCEYCGESFTLPQSRADGRRYCSTQCAGAAKRESAAVDIECEQCGKSFTLPQSHADGRRYCSRQCYGAARKGGGDE